MKQTHSQVMRFFGFSVLLCASGVAAALLQQSGHFVDALFLIGFAFAVVGVFGCIDRAMLLGSENRTMDIWASSQSVRSGCEAENICTVSEPRISTVSRHPYMAAVAVSGIILFVLSLVL